MEKEILEIAAICLYLLHDGFLVTDLEKHEHRGSIPFALDVKGGEWSWRLCGCHQVQRGRLLALWFRCCPWWQTHSGDKSRRTQEICSASASPQVYHAEPASRDAGQPFRRCVRPVHTFQGREKHVGVSCVVSSRRFCVSMVSARGIVPCFGEKLAYIKQRSSFGLGIILVEYLLVRSSPDLWGRIF